MADARVRKKLCKTVISCTLQTGRGGEDSRLMDEATARVHLEFIIVVIVIGMSSSACRRERFLEPNRHFN